MDIPNFPYIAPLGYMERREHISKRVVIPPSIGSLSIRHSRPYPSIFDAEEGHVSRF
jgi:hypothetical protein